MKIIDRVIYPFQEKDFFFAVRNKIDYARIIVLAARQFLLNMNENEVEAIASMRLVVDRMSRLFFYKEKKYYSIAFPFTTILDGDEIIKLTSYTGKEVDSKSISAVISILDNEQFRLNPSLIDFYIEPNSIDSFGLFLLEEIFQSEPSYVRYDCDPVNQKGKLHPLNHLDINYSQYGTFKFGLNQEINQAYFENLHNIRTDCSFVVD